MAPGIPLGSLCLAAPRTVLSARLHVGCAGAVVAAFTCSAAGGPGRERRRQERLRGAGASGAQSHPGAARLTSRGAGHRSPPPSRHHVQEAEAEDQRGAGAAARGGGTRRPPHAAGTAGLGVSVGSLGGPGRSHGRLVVSGRAPVASRPEGRRVREGLGVALASGRTGPVPPPWPRDGGAAQALLCCACCPADSSAMGCAATSKANFAVTEPPPVLGVSPEAAETVLWSLYKGCLPGECQNHRLLEYRIG